MRLDPYISVDGVPFSATQADIIALHGPPLREHRNEVALTELDYGNVIYRFQDCGRLEEITTRAQTLNLQTVCVPFSALKSFIAEQDTERFERAGFIVSPRFGLVFVPDCPDWITALAAHGVEQWEAMRPTLEMR